MRHDLYGELRAVQHTMNVSRTWAGNEIAQRNLDRRETELCREISNYVPRYFWAWYWEQQGEGIHRAFIKAETKEEAETIFLKEYQMYNPTISHIEIA